MGESDGLEGIVSGKKKWDWRVEIAENEYMSPIQREAIIKLHNPDFRPFRLDQSFVSKYAKKKPGFGFNGLGEFTFYRTYSRIKPDQTKERWHETVERVVNGTFNIQKRFASENGRPWNDYTARKHAEEMYERIFSFKFTPPGRGLWAMGTEITEERGLFAALNNCAFVSTDRLDDLEYGFSKPFRFLMDMSMIGVGVGFDAKGAGKLIVRGPDKRRSPERFAIPDTREGWVESGGRLIDSYFLGISPMDFDYSKIRGYGEVITGFGGKSAGVEPLRELHRNLEQVLRQKIGWPISTTSIVDMQNFIGKSVVAGNVRRTAEIAFGYPNDEEFLDLKNPGLYASELRDRRWASNNSVLAEIGMDYSEIADRIVKNGEPGLIWLENMRHFRRMGDPRGDWDSKAEGANPCVEQTLESYEICDLVETYPANHESYEDFERTLKYAYMYGKTVTLAMSHWKETNQVLQRNRRIGTSISGVQQFIKQRGLNELVQWSNRGYDAIRRYDAEYSDEWFAIPRSIKVTSIKPSGTVSLLAGATPGVHWPTGGEYYLRRVNLAKNDPLVQVLAEHNYHVEPSVTDPTYTVVAEFPVHSGDRLRSEEEVSVWEQLSIAALMQRHWADNQVSATIKFDAKRDRDQIARALDIFQYQLKGISFLPHTHGFKQAPYEPITREEYIEKTRRLKPLDFSKYVLNGTDAIGEKFCGTDSCEIQPYSGVGK